MNDLSFAYAQATEQPQAPNPGQAQSPSPMGSLTSFLPLILVFGVFYFLILRPQRKQQKERQEMINAIKRGDEVVTNGGLHGTVMEVSDGLVKLQIAQNVVVKLERSQVGHVVNLNPQSNTSPAKPTARPATKPR